MVVLMDGLVVFGCLSLIPKEELQKLVRLDVARETTAMS